MKGAANCGPFRSRIGFAEFRSLRGSLHLGAGGLDDRRKLVFIGRTEGGGIGRSHPDRRGALLLESREHALALQGLPGKLRELLDHRYRQAGRAADAAPRSDLEARQIFADGRDFRYAGCRLAEVTATPRTLPPRIRPSGPGMLSNIMSVWLARMSW